MCVVFFEYHQNNSGGSFHYSYERGIARTVIIEAATASKADALAQEVGLYFDGSQDCSCCGNRWSSNDTYWGGNGTETPEVHGSPAALATHDGWRDNMKWEGFIHFLDGRKVGFAHIDGPGLEVPNVPKPLKGPLKAIRKAA